MRTPGSISTTPLTGRTAAFKPLLAITVLWFIKVLQLRPELRQAGRTFFDALFGLYVIMPWRFMGSLGLHGPGGDAHGLGTFVWIYWPLLLALHWIFMRDRRWRLFVVLVLIFVLS